MNHALVLEENKMNHARVLEENKMSHARVLEDKRLQQSNKFNSILLILLGFGVVALFVFGFQLRDGLIGKVSSFDLAIESFKLQVNNFKFPVYCLVFNTLSDSFKEVLGLVVIIRDRVWRRYVLKQQ